MIVELAAPVVLVENIDALWHIPAPTRRTARRLITLQQAVSDAHQSTMAWPTRCGLGGPVYRYAGPILRRRCCSVCAARPVRQAVTPQPPAAPGRVAWAEVRAQLEPRLPTGHGATVALSRATGVPHSTCSRLLNGHHTHVSRSVADRLLTILDQERLAA